MLQQERGKGLGAAAAILIVLGIIIAAALSFNMGQNAIRLITVTQTQTSVDSITVTTVQTSFSTVTVTTTPPNYFQVNALVLHSGTASSKTAQGSAYLEFTVTGPLLTTTTASAAIISIQISNTTMTVAPSIFLCASSTSCSLLSNALVKQYGVTSFTTATTAFFIGAIIDRGDSYDYNILFSNGNAAAGSLVSV